MDSTDYVHAGPDAVVGKLFGTRYLATLFGLTLLSHQIGAFFGAWASSMVASSVPNSRLKVFERDIENGKVLMMVDVPIGRAKAICELVSQRHPEALSGGFEHSIPAFP